MVKKKITKHYIPPDMFAIKILFETIKETVGDDNFKNISISPYVGSSRVTYLGSYSSLPTPTRSGYTFRGWYTGNNCGGSKITANTIVTTVGDHTLYACWTNGNVSAPDLSDGLIPVKIDDDGQEYFKLR